MMKRVKILMMLIIVLLLVKCGQDSKLPTVPPPDGSPPGDPRRWDPVRDDSYPPVERIACEGINCPSIEDSINLGNEYNNINSCEDGRDNDLDGILDCDEFYCYKFKNCCIEQENILDLSKCVNNNNECEFILYSTEEGNLPEIKFQEYYYIEFKNSNPYDMQLVTTKLPLRINGPLEFSFKIEPEENSIIGFILVDRELWDLNFSSDILPQWGIVVDKLTKRVLVYKNGIETVKSYCDNNEDCNITASINIGVKEKEPTEKYIQGEISFKISGITSPDTTSFYFDKSYYPVMFSYGKGRLYIISSNKSICTELTGWNYYKDNYYSLILNWSTGYKYLSSFINNNNYYLLFNNGFRIYLLKILGECNPEFISECNSFLEEPKELQLPPIPTDIEGSLRYGEKLILNPILLYDNYSARYLLFYLGEREQNNKKAILLAYTQSLSEPDWHYYNNNFKDSILIEEENLGQQKIIDFDVVPILDYYVIYTLLKDNTGKLSIYTFYFKFTDRGILLSHLISPSLQYDLRYEKNKRFNLEGTKEIEVEVVNGIFYLWVVKSERGEYRIYMAESSDSKLWYFYPEPIFTQNEYLDINDTIDWISISINEHKRYLYLLTSGLKIRPFFQEIVNR